MEDELSTTIMATTAYQHKFKEAGRLLNVGFNYTFHREDEKYFYDNYLPASTGTDAFKLLSDEQVYHFNNRQSCNHHSPIKPFPTAPPE